MAELLRSIQQIAVSDAAVRARSIAAQQWGVISWWQLLDCGLGRGTIENWIERGWLHRIHPGVYALGHIRIPIEGRMVAALLYAGKGAAVSQATATWWWELTPEEPATIAVSAPGRRSSLPDVDVHHPLTLHTTRHRQFLITTPERALLDYAATATPEEVRLALSEADYRGRLDNAAIHGVMGRGQTGSTKLAHALRRHEPRLAYSRSRLERKFLALCKRYGLPLPELNSRLGLMTIDALFRAQRVAVELDGYKGHRSHAQLERDRRRELHVRDMQHIPLRYTEDMIDNEPDLVAADLRAQLNRSAPSA
jgi:very-short-patch-repair endonuclease